MLRELPHDFCSVAAIMVSLFVGVSAVREQPTLTCAIGVYFLPHGNAAPFVETH